jgi:membrane protease YdiL (CAAX protease family)
MLLDEIVSAVLQVGVALILALVAWLITIGVLRLRRRDAPSFTRYVGLIAPRPRAMLWALVATIVFGAATIALFKFTALADLATASNTVGGRIRAMGVSAETAGVIAITAFVKTALSEEIVFRGLLAKRLIAWAGFGIGNTIHAALFGAVHLLIFIIPGGPAWDPAAAAAFFLVTGCAGWVMAWLNERIGEGSIAPSWLMHGLANAVAYPALAFL